MSGIVVGGNESDGAGDACFAVRTLSDTFGVETFFPFTSRDAAEAFASFAALNRPGATARVEPMWEASPAWVYILPFSDAGLPAGAILLGREYSHTRAIHMRGVSCTGEAA